MSAAFFEYLLRLGDDRLVLGHRTSEWCGHGPILEEDIALTNIALDLVGEANLLLQRAGQVEGKGRDQDALAYLRNDREFRNALMVELPRGDFGYTMKTRAVALRDLGPTMAPMNAFMTLTGIETLHLRMERQIGRAHV